MLRSRDNSMIMLISLIKKERRVGVGLTLLLAKKQ